VGKFSEHRGLWWLVHRTSHIGSEVPMYLPRHSLVAYVGTLNTAHLRIVLFPTSPGSSGSSTKTVLSVRCEV